MSIFYHPRGAARNLWTEPQPGDVLDLCVEGPAGTGKTRALCELMHYVCETYPGARCLIARRYRASLTESVMVSLERDVLPPDHESLRTGASRRVRQSYAYRNGSAIVLGGLDNAERLYSTEWDVAWLNEAAEDGITEAEYESLRRALRSWRVPWQALIGDCNPSYESHWLNQRCLAGRSRRIVTRHADNPSLRPEYIEALAGLTGWRRARLFEGRWANAEGAVYDCFAGECDPIEIPRDWPRVGAVDFGYRNPFSAIWLAHDRANDTMHVYRQLYGAGVIVEDWAGELRRRCADDSVEAVVCDHDAEDRATLSRHGVANVAAWKSIRPGIEDVYQRIESGRLLVHRGSLLPHSSHGELRNDGKPGGLAEELARYSWPDGKRGRGESELPVDQDNHACDALRYGVTYWTRRSAVHVGLI